ncbi:hypothetical protein WN73_37885 [Bradyrhizobium sp. CCBAU 45394]|uniref:hypothetical protein n=1 Tax=Bradyrhizobium sp. CCBAU 45394 TaxID=1325087 RepID=UPI0023032324|nr:hypothetical protein [Bradyrhizobium sp. CCBAU 45394]MDA9396286.1 hypothetical protein [Bradyrhizobium sp. CCBAU 45394]
MDVSETEKQARDAINRYTSTVAYPVIWTDGNKIITLGTAVLFRYRDRHFLLTAKHLFQHHAGERFPYDGLVGPTTRAQGVPRGLGKIEVLEPKGDDADFLDVIAIELLDPEMVGLIKHTWSFITIDDFAPPNPEAVYFIAGFPKEKERKSGEIIGAALMTLATKQAESVPDGLDRHDPKFDLFCKYDQTGADFYNNNETVVSPWVGGVSGGPAFRVADLAPPVWTPQSGTRFVGLQSSASEGKRWLRIKNCYAIVAYFKEACPEIAEAILAQLAR